MQAIFYENKSDRRYLTKNIEGKYPNVPVQIIEPSSVVRPSLKVSSGLIGQNVNYLKLVDLERYYYINDWIMENGYIRLECEVDVLMSFKDEIKERSVVVKRNEKKYNLYLDDPKYKIQNRTATMTKEFPNGFGTAKHLVMGVVGKKQEEGGNS